MCSSGTAYYISHFIVLNAKHSSNSQNKKKKKKKPPTDSKSKHNIAQSVFNVKSTLENHFYQEYL